MAGSPALAAEGGYNPIRKRKLSNKDALEQLCFLLKTGVPWRHIPMTLCSPSAVYKRYRHWLSHDIFDRAWVELTALYANNRLESDPSWFHDLFIDTTMIKNVGGIDGLGKNPTDRGRLATKMGVVVDSAAIPIAFQFFEANRNDVTTTVPTIEQILCHLRKDRRYKHALIGDKGYISKDVAEALKE
jgi:putative transposase